MPAPCPYCGKDCGNDYNVEKHKKACYKRPPSPPKQRPATPSGTPDGTPSPSPPSGGWPTYRPVSATPTGTGTAPVGAPGRVVSSGLWKTLASLENAFLSRGKVICTDDQDMAMDQNLQAILGKSGQPVSPWAGFIVGLLGIFIAPLVVEFAPMIKEAVGKWWEKQQKKKEDAKDARRSGDGNNSTPAKA